MTITLYRFDQAKQEVREQNPLRRVEVPALFNVPAVREGIKKAVGNNGGPLALEFKETIMKCGLRLAFIFDTGEDGFSLREFSDIFAERIVVALREKSQAMLHA